MFLKIIWFVENSSFYLHCFCKIHSLPLLCHWCWVRQKVEVTLALKLLPAVVSVQPHLLAVLELHSRPSRFTMLCESFQA